ncbi:MAG: FHA domain-containing protein [Candidatus Acidiferrum sp.]
MGVLLEVKAGPFAGKKVAVVSGQTVTFGRAAGRAQFAFPDDTFMSGVHFAVECGPGGCRAVDKKSSNGTFLNGARIKDAMLANGDEIKGGQTVFSVKIVADAKLASLTPPQEALSSSAVRKKYQAEQPARSDASVKIRRAEEPPAAPIKPSSEPPPSRNVPAGEPVPRASSASSFAQPEALPPAARSVAGEHESVSGSIPAAEPMQAERSAARSSESPLRAPSSRIPLSQKNFAFSVMGWSFPSAPADWQVQEGFGLQQMGHEDFPASVAASEEFLGGITLQQFVESQISILRGYLRDPKIEPTMPPRVSGAEESMAMDVRHSTKDGRELLYRRIYVRSGTSVGVLTVTTLASDFAEVMQSLKTLLDGAAFLSTGKN